MVIFRRIVESGRLELSRIFSWVRIIQSDQSVIEKPIQLLYPMELHCDLKATTSNTQDEKTLNINTEEFRPKRSAAAVAE